MASRATPTAEIPPHNLEAERAILGALLLEGADSTRRVAGNLLPEDFYLEAHRTLYRRILALIEAEHAVDILVVTDALRQAGELEAAGGEPGLALLLEHGSICAHLEDYLRIVKRAAGQRAALHVLTDALRHAANSTGPAA